MKDKIVKQFKELVSIDSHSKEEGEIATYLSNLLEEWGLEVTTDDAGEKIDGETGNIIAKLKGDPDLPTLLFCAHMDTVIPGENVEAVIEDDVIYSQGDTILGSDDKAGITAILGMLKAIQERDIEHGDIEIVFTVAEEIGLLGAKNLNYDLLEADLGIIYDSGGPIGTIVTQAPAQDQINVEVIGKSAHAGLNPSGGVNAIKVSSMAISNLNLGQIDEETTANIGVIKGGHATNIVPDLVELEGEARSRDEDKLEQQIEHMIDIFEKSAKKYSAEVNIDVERMYSAFDLTESDPSVKLVVEAAKNLGVEPKLEATGGGSDANILNGQGIETVNLGVGMTDVHSTDENIKVKDLVDAVRYSVEIVKESANLF
ncbi:M20/M25/M40 family metallo-hydrolase [Halanaerobacter jeridensis]|uniref:Tripeptide aminopeptidase n=1 Tax=Halanaerobacter jeridensis TaxID=706427 RepID=A0A938XU25_9FIRM|nr:M20/M25/M40 family metallo-hydrolase [Halanaerobacter jeridensis]MBM7555255.1 tripeptide aminopeptidase [Halanaerobacter jeridensis]